MTSGCASATCLSPTRSPAGTTILPPHRLTNSATQGGELMRGFGHASQYTRKPRIPFFELRRSAENPFCILPTRVSAAFAQPTIAPSMRMSAYTSASDRGFIARKFRGCSKSLAMVSCLYGTEPITSVGLSRRISSTDSMCQQSPSLGRPSTGATSAHHLVTPTSVVFAPRAHRIEVALGASETMRRSLCSFFSMLLERITNVVPALLAHQPYVDSASRVWCTSFLNLEETRALSYLDRHSELAAFYFCSILFCACKT